MPTILLVRDAMQTIEPITAKAVRTSENDLIIVLADRAVRVPWARCSPPLAGANAEQRANLELSPGGYGIHWPLLDEDLSVAGLVARIK